MEADRIGFKTSVATGFHKDEAGKFYSKLLEMEKAHKKDNTPILSSVADAMSTHPPSEERVAQMREMAAQTPKQPNPRVSSKDFDRMKKVCQDWIKANPPKKA